MAKRQFTDFNTVNCRFVRIIQVGGHENRYCQIGSISQPLGNPIAARLISGKLYVGYPKRITYH